METKVGEARAPGKAALIVGIGASAGGLEPRGLTLAQDPETAKYDAMPRAAIEAGAVHQVLPTERMPARLIERARDVAEGRGRIAAQQTAAPPNAESPSGEQLATALEQIFPILLAKTGHDFSHYKRGTVVRRLRRRIQLRRGSCAAPRRS